MGARGESFAAGRIEFAFLPVSLRAFQLTAETFLPARFYNSSVLCLSSSSVEAGGVFL